jgi:Peptidase A4 family
MCRRAAWIVVSVGLAAWADTALASPAAVRVSSNWAGYAVSARSATGPTMGSFTRVSGSWVVPKPRCTGGQTFSAVWVGLGGFDPAAQGLEQIGTETDCSRAGTTSGHAWYELLPAAPIRLELRVAAGDTVSATAKVLTESTVVLTIRNVSSGAAVAKTVRVQVPDFSSAEWIVEAPSACGSYGGCRPLPLTNFGTISFSNCSATANGHTGSISDRGWSQTALQLGGNDSLGAYFGPGRWRWAGERPMSASVARPAQLTRHGSSFTVSWHGSAGTAEPPRSRPARQYSA